MAEECLKCGTCCKLFLITLTEEEYKSKKYKTQFEELDGFEFIEDFNFAEECGANIIKQNKDDSCIYLINGKCSIHETRPEACRNFFCDSKDEQFKGMIEDIDRAKNKF